jgi:hypothetical protein
MLMTAIRRLREKWRVRRDRIRRLNAARFDAHGKTDRLEGPGAGN